MWYGIYKLCDLFMENAGINQLSSSHHYEMCTYVFWYLFWEYNILKYKYREHILWRT